MRKSYRFCVIVKLRSAQHLFSRLYFTVRKIGLLRHRYLQKIFGGVFYLENIVTFLMENPLFVLQCLSMIGSIILSIVLTIITKDVKYVKEVYKMIKYRLPSYKEDTPAKGQKFSNLKPVYRLNKVTNELEETDEYIDVTELANSCKDIALQTVLDRFLPTDGSEELTANYNQTLDALDQMREIANLAEDYKEKLNLDSSLSIQDVFAKVQEHSNSLKQRIDTIQSNVKKLTEVKQDEKETIKEEK